MFPRKNNFSPAGACPPNGASGEGAALVFAGDEVAVFFRQPVTDNKITKVKMIALLFMILLILILLSPFESIRL
jgi:hypothetical protein